MIRFVPDYGGALVWDKPLRQPGAKASRVPLDAINQVELEVKHSLFIHIAGTYWPCVCGLPVAACLPAPPKVFGSHHRLNGDIRKTLFAAPGEGVTHTGG